MVINTCPFAVIYPYVQSYYSDVVDVRWMWTWMGRLCCQRI